jgi:transcriptional regulator with XRE-family HTH domain
MRIMGKAGRTLQTVLEAYNISQSKLASVLGIGRSNVYRWVKEVRDPNSETLIRIIRGLEKINPEAASRFKILYLEDLGGDEPSEE